MDAFLTLDYGLGSAFIGLMGVSEDGDAIPHRERAMWKFVMIALVACRLDTTIPFRHEASANLD